MAGHGTTPTKQAPKRQQPTRKQGNGTHVTDKGPIDHPERRAVYPLDRAASGALVSRLRAHHAAGGLRRRLHHRHGRRRAPHEPGLGCTQWPTCESGQIVAPLEWHPWVEFGNRLVTGLVSVAVVLAALGAVIRVPRRRDLIWWSLGLVATIPAQAVLGGVSVLMDLAPPLISAHFLLSVVVLWNALVLHHKATEPEGPAVAIVDAPTVRLGRGLLALSVAVLVSGTIVTGTGPHAGDEKATRYTFSTITDVTRVHSVLAWLFLLAAVFTLWRIAAQRRARGRSTPAPACW